MPTLNRRGDTDPVVHVIQHRLGPVTLADFLFTPTAATDRFRVWQQVAPDHLVESVAGELKQAPEGIKVVALQLRQGLQKLGLL